mmetsp:Transcript_8445/g.13701  ORF Transcript_8445/g.13701 Transcript_8445/m.13701 type:complete len:144 (-) Transcript_8445:1015-1446(-)|eukprot:CAMPEP_0203777102 /NCGR_PEP_ID=MMETSP0099_2-20121227/7180_1 /ASSEMBLY_ACC=CAM_ASM_000209 /TAXON_ID=96639 /ORGANISM=" , Strain NY0313808BC1" /LENGTH=143 /DNA_ID=CAMNT_0050676313 /DNA_START=423 /DNA_END=854 /DNA_ORIENTATION=+
MSLVALRTAARYEPPTVAVELQDVDSGSFSLAKFVLLDVEHVDAKQVAQGIVRRLEERDVQTGERCIEDVYQAVRHLCERFQAKRAMEEESDLNKVAPGVLEQAKKCMESKFKENVLKPGDEGYIYDKRVEFSETISENSWDD